MSKDLKQDFRDINSENKGKEDSKITSFDIIMGLLIGSFFYFAYYILMKDYFKVNPFRFPYILISIYLAIATLLFPYFSKRVSLWTEGNKTIRFLSTSKIAMPFAYIFAPIIFLIDLF
ncbi:MAG: hypothetical protein ACTHW2_06250 [Tissierella sp.]|uniref:hypothetical protein n=1 Tax=Tissierella sp. TaxID=41274 RepID=UPI003F9BB305